VIELRFVLPAAIKIELCFYLLSLHVSIFSSSWTQITKADVTDVASLAQAVAGCAVVVNCAGIYRWWVPDTSVYKSVNEDGARNVAEACCSHADKGCRLVHISTAMAFGFPKDMPFNEDSAPGPFAAEYPRSKAKGDALVWNVAQSHGLQTVVLYLGCVSGAGDTFSTGRPASVYRDFMQGKIPMLVGPNSKYIYVHINDVTKVN
jgi:nucleoside-diphosphate-sugar epimerase